MSVDGAQAERQAAAYLQARGLEIVERNWRCRFGEIDLIARQGLTLVFVEVRARRSRRYGGAAFSITPAKCARWMAAAEHYLATLSPQPACRFDAVCIDHGRIEWLQHCLDVSN
ncbi:YraN family protein [Silvimonas sp. JCM 19000]